jgi:O-antigen ligase
MTLLLDNGQDESPPLTRALDRLALLIALAIVIARCTMPEAIRDPMTILPGSEAAPRGSGAVPGLVLSLLSFVPAMLVLLRRLIDRSPLCRSWAIWGLIALGFWALASSLWAADQFLAALSTCNWLAAMALLWAVAQVAHEPKNQRLIAGVGIGLLLVFIVQALFYHYREFPAVQEMVAQQQDQILRQRGMSPDSFVGKQFLRKVASGEASGFSASPNTFAALIVVTMVLAAGMSLQRLVGKRRWGWVVLAVVAIAGGPIIIGWTHSRAAVATSALAALAFVVFGLWAHHLRRWRVALFRVGAAGFVGLIAIGLRHGLTTGTLFQDSLTFRWRYWVGAFRVLREHLWRGVGWENFSYYYLAKRLPAASEEVHDPHNFIVRFAVELGVIAGIAVVVLMVRLLWEITMPAKPTGEPPPVEEASDDVRPSLAAILTIPALLAIAAIGINALCSIDLSQNFDYVDLELRRRLLYAVLLTIGIVSATTGWHGRPERPLPWIRSAFVIATILFLIHNLIDFSLFETGGMFLFATIAGAAVGAVDRRIIRPQRKVVGAALAIVAIGSLAWLVAIVVPVAAAETDAQQGADLARTNHRGAADAYARAVSEVGYNYDYANKAAESLIMEHAGIEDIRRWIDRAIAINPMAVSPRLLEAHFEEQLPTPSADRLLAGYDTVLSLDPQNVPARLDFAAALVKLGQPARAVEQLHLALTANAGLDPAEPKRLSPDRIAQINATIAKLLQ